MATTNSITTTYIGKDSKQFISPVLESGRTLGIPGVTIKNNVNYKTRITTLALTDIIQDATCDFTPSGTVDQGESWIEVKPLEVNLQLCRSDYYNDFIGSDMGCKDPLPSTFTRYLVSQVGANVSDALETMVWQGLDAANSFAGFQTKFEADVKVTKLPGGVALDPSNVITEIRKVIAAAPSALLSKSDTYLYVPSDVYQIIREANNDKNNASPCGEECMKIDGIQIFLAPGMKAGTMVLARKSNLFFGTWVNSDLTQVAVKDMSQVDLSDNIRFKMCFFGGVGYGYGEEIVYYTAFS